MPTGSSAWTRRPHQPIREAPPRLPVRPANHGHQFRYLCALIRLVATRNRVFDAMRHVILEHFFLDAPQRRTDRRDLGDDIDAIAVLVHHPGQAAHLALDAVQTLLTGRLDVFSHAAYIPLAGICCKAGRSSRWAKLTRRPRPAAPGNPAAAAPL